jgi:hypothetical protein
MKLWSGIEFLLLFCCSTLNAFQNVLSVPIRTVRAKIVSIQRGFSTVSATPGCRQPALDPIKNRLFRMHRTPLALTFPVHPFPFVRFFAPVESAGDRFRCKPTEMNRAESGWYSIQRANL